MTYYSDKLLKQQIATASGDVVNQIPSLSGYALQSWVSS